MAAMLNAVTLSQPCLKAAREIKIFIHIKAGDLPAFVFEKTF